MQTALYRAGGTLVIGLMARKWRRPVQCTGPAASSAKFKTTRTLLINNCRLRVTDQIHSTYTLHLLTSSNLDLRQFQERPPAKLHVRGMNITSAVRLAAAHLFISTGDRNTSV